MKIAKKDIKPVSNKRSTAKATAAPLTGNNAILSVSNSKEYAQTMARIDELIKIPEEKLTLKQVDELHKLAVAAQRYEQSVYIIKPPSTFEGILEMKMYELKLTQGEMAKKLHVSNAKFSLILNGKQKPDIYFLKTMNEILGIDGNYLLSVL